MVSENKIRIDNNMNIKDYVINNIKEFALFETTPKIININNISKVNTHTKFIARNIGGRIYECSLFFWNMCKYRF